MSQREMVSHSAADAALARAPSAPMPTVPEGMNPMVGVKLWQNPCRLSYRANYIAHHFNAPIYDWVARTYQLTRPEHVALYAIGLREGISAEDIASSSSQPANTLSRAVNRLLRRKLITRVLDTEDRRRRRLYLTGAGRRILDVTVPALMAREEVLLEALSAEERETLNYLMTKLILNQANWPIRIDEGE